MPKSRTFTQSTISARRTSITFSGYLDDVRVLQLARDLRLAMEALDELRIAGHLAVEDLHGHVAIDAALVRAVDAAHRADARDRPELDVAADDCADVRVAVGIDLGVLGRERGRS
jgi:hypothetical protein